MIYKINYDNSDCIGVYLKLTNSYCITPDNPSKTVLKTIKSEVSSKFPVIQTTILGSRSIGRLLVGNRNGIIVPYQTTSQEFANLKNLLPENIIIKRSSDSFSALGNSVSVNDYSALVNPNVGNDIVELINDVLCVEVFKTSIGKESLTGSYSIFNNNGGIIHPIVSHEEQDELCSLLEIPLLFGTVNNGSRLVSTGIVSNDSFILCGLTTTQSEIYIIETAFGKKINKKI